MFVLTSVEDAFFLLKTCCWRVYSAVPLRHWGNTLMALFNVFIERIYQPLRLEQLVALLFQVIERTELGRISGGGTTPERRSAPSPTSMTSPKPRPPPPTPKEAHLAQINSMSKAIAYIDRFSEELLSELDGQEQSFLRPYATLSQVCAPPGHCVPYLSVFS
jgi:hypothetical protein